MRNNTYRYSHNNRTPEVYKDTSDYNPTDDQLGQDTSTGGNPKDTSGIGAGDASGTGYGGYGKAMSIGSYLAYVFTAIFLVTTVLGLLKK